MGFSEEVALMLGVFGVVVDDLHGGVVTNETRQLDRRADIVGCRRTSLPQSPFAKGPATGEHGRRHHQNENEVDARFHCFLKGLKRLIKIIHAHAFRRHEQVLGLALDFRIKNTQNGPLQHV